MRSVLTACVRHVYAEADGTTSCVLAEMTANTGEVISVEPDHRVHRHLLNNRRSHNCSFHAWLGTFGTQPLVFGGFNGLLTHGAWRPDFETTYIPATIQSARWAAPNVRNVHELEAATGVRINAVLVDCEGCIEHVLDTDLPGQVELLLMEEDGFWAPERRHKYAHFHERLRGLGLERFWRWQGRNSSEEHSAWRRRGTMLEAPSCSEYIARMGYTQESGMDGQFARGPAGAGRCLPVE